MNRNLFEIPANSARSRKKRKPWTQQTKIQVKTQRTSSTLQYCHGKLKKLFHLQSCSLSYARPAICSNSTWKTSKRSKCRLLFHQNDQSSPSPNGTTSSEDARLTSTKSSQECTLSDRMLNEPNTWVLLNSSLVKLSQSKESEQVERLPMLSLTEEKNWPNTENTCKYRRYLWIYIVIYAALT
jgi:hypothetical protein